MSPIKLPSVPSPKLTHNLVLLCWIAVALASLACNPAAILGPTPTPTASSTPTATLTPTVTPTPVPSSTPLPTETAEPLALLVLEDLPSGFEAVPAGYAGLIEGQEFSEGFIIGEAFVYVEPSRLEFLVGFTTRFENRLQQVGFDSGLERPELLIDANVAGLGETGYEEVTVLEGADQIGDKSSGLRMVFRSGPLSFQREMIIFRKGEVGAFLMLTYFEGDTPLTSIQELAGIIADRIPAGP